MKLPALVAVLAAVSAAHAGPLEKSDRERILRELNVSRQQFLDAIANLSQARWTYHAGPDRWSIAEISEHIIAAEDYIGSGMNRRLMATPADPGKAEQRRPGISKMDEGFLAGLRDRSQKVSAPAEIVPKGIYKTPDDAAEAFKAAREKTLEYARTTGDALRDHFATPFPGFEMDGVQGLLMVAGHNERHVLQILEVKQAPGYPAK
ncbi:MAG: DinB family protein [Acidobacteriota bacterium]